MARFDLFKISALFEKLDVVAVTFGLEFVDGNESERGRVHTVPESGWLRTIVEDMSEMSVALGAADLGPDHTQRSIGLLEDDFRIDRLGKTWPTSTRVELVLRNEKRLARDHIDINPGLVIVPIGISEGRLSPVLFRNIILLWRQSLFQFVIGKLRHIGSRV